MKIWMILRLVWWSKCKYNSKFSFCLKPTRTGEEGRAVAEVSPQAPVWGRSSSPLLPTRCTPDRAPPLDLWQPPCPGRGPAKSEPAELPWPWRWSSGRGGHTSTGPRALKETMDAKEFFKIHSIGSDYWNGGQTFTVCSPAWQIISGLFSQ